MHLLAAYQNCPSHLEQPSRIAGYGNGKEVRKLWRQQGVGHFCSRRIIRRMSPLPSGVVTRTDTDWFNSSRHNLKSPPKLRSTR